MQRDTKIPPCRDQTEHAMLNVKELEPFLKTDRNDLSATLKNHRTGFCAGFLEKPNELAERDL
jgi:hypothetical protein